MQNQRQSIITTTSRRLTQTVQHLFDVPTQPGIKRLLHAQPLAQRRYFLSRALREQVPVHVQLLPMTKAGYPVNAHGKLTRLDHNRFRITDKNLTYIFNFHQLNYISRLALSAIA